MAARWTGWPKVSRNRERFQMVRDLSFGRDAEQAAERRIAAQLGQARLVGRMP